MNLYEIFINTVAHGTENIAGDTDPNVDQGIFYGFFIIALILNIEADHGGGLYLSALVCMIG